MVATSVQQYRAAYVKEAGKLSGLLTTAPAKAPFIVVRSSKSSS